MIISTTDQPTTHRTVKFVAESVPAIEGAGVHLRRAFGNLQGVNLDPFLLLDEMHSNDPRDTAPGFPWHPHRGIETMSIMLDGAMAHGDSLGNTGLLKPGDVQYMTGGSGIIHQEMPEPEKTGLLRGLQLWINLPKSHKMMMPRYQEISRQEIPLIQLPDGIGSTRLIAGQFGSKIGPVDDIPTQPRVMEVNLEPDSTFVDYTPQDHTMIIYVLDGSGNFENTDRLNIKDKHLVVMNDGDQFTVMSGNETLRFLMFSGKPIREPVAWAGPVVMNTQEELIHAFQEMRSGDFIKHEYKI